MFKLEFDSVGDYRNIVTAQVGFEKAACGRASVRKMLFLASRSLRIGFVKGYLGSYSNQPISPHAAGLPAVNRRF
jgi:hypothetical protein